MRAACLLIGALALAAVLAMLAGTALAVQPGPVSYRGAGEGDVIFDHGLHAARGFACADCHTSLGGSGRQLFATRKIALIDRAAHDRDAFCFACHDGKKASKDCGYCHRNP
jgi:c(7)-type cytochrome triheme protein